MDDRCFRGDHDFDMEDVYDVESGEYRSHEQQLKAKCIRCGRTLGESINALSSECEVRLGIKKAQ